MQAKQLPVIKSDPSKQLPSSEAGKYWRSLSELEQTPEFEQFLHREFPQAASEFPSGVSRRRWLKLMSASLALSGAAGCRYGPNEFAAYVQRPENMTPGIAKLYATSFELAGRAVHLLVRNTEGRPIKVEGNAAHPLMRASEPNELGAEGEKSRFASGGTDVFSQGCVLGLYDPDRAHRVAKRSEGKLVDSTWGEFAEYAASHFETLKSKQGESHAILLSPTCSPSVKRLLSELVKTLPQARIALYSSIDRSSQVSAASQAAGQPAELLFNLGAAKVICCLDADLLGNDHNSVVYSRQFSKGREPIVGQMNRLYSVEARYSITGASADARLAVRSSQIGAFLGRLETRVDELLAGGNSTAFGSDEKPFDKIEASEQLVRMVESMAEDLVANKGAGLVAVGEFQPVEVHLAALRLNKKLGNNGHTVFLTSSRSHIEGVSSVALGDLVEDIEKGAITSLWVLGDNPAYTAPGDVKLGDALKKLDHAVYFAEFEDETAQCCSWSLPLAHPLEAWGDVTSIDGSYCVGQPQILPLLGGKSTVEILSLLAGHEGSGEEIVRETASAVLGEHVTSRTWREALHAGFVVSQSNVLDSEWTTEGEPQSSELDLEDFENGDLEINIVPSDTIYDGRFAKNVWLQELPQVMTKIVWDNAAIMSPATAKKLGVSHGLVVKLVKDNAALELPVFQMPGQADGTITLHLGYGRVCRDEAVNSNNEAVVGSDVSVLRSMSSLHLVTGVEARNTSRPYKLVTTQDHFAIDKLGMDETVKRAPTLVREGTLEQIQEYGSDYVEHHLGTHHPALESLWEEPIDVFEKDTTVPYQWGMTIDLNKCTGCNACVVACQAENNVPVVGKEQVGNGREMHWLRLDRYFRGTVETPKIVSQPVACVHCETAPCEQVCPVAATVHTEEGINAMAYNRCIGTRYCANNCPYKVRRFNYFNYNTEYGYYYGWKQRGELEKASRKLQQLVLNPDVSVRGRGVMEKCTYCIQRVQNGKIAARKDGRPVADGEVLTACQEACPSQAIVFGDLNDSNSRVSQLRNRDVRAYAMLAELNIEPRTIYLARVRNTPARLKTADQLESPAHHGVEHAEAGHASGEHVESGTEAPVESH